MCTTEMTHLKSYDKDNAIKLVDIHLDDFDSLYPDIKFDEAMKILHAYYHDQLLLGLEVTHRAWTIVGKGFWVAPLNWPVIKRISHLVYLAIAKYRHPLSAMLAKIFGIKSTNCITGACYDISKNTDHRRK